MAEVFGMEVNMKLIPDNLDDFVKQVEGSVKNIRANVTAQVGSMVSGMQSGAFGTGSGAEGIAGIVGKMTGATRLITEAIKPITDTIKRIFSLIENSSPYLKGIMGIFERATMYFFKPFGDFLATLLKPLAITLLKASTSWMQMFRKTTPEEKPAEGAALGSSEQGEEIAKNIAAAFKGVFDLGVWLGDNLAEFVIGTFNFGVWLGDQLAEFLIGAFNLGVWLGEKIAEYITGDFDIGEWLGDNFGEFFENLFDIGEWLGDKIAEYITGTFDIGQWLGDQFWSFITGSFDFGTWLIDHIWDFLTGKSKNALPYFDEPYPPKQSGTDFVQETGLYQLHRGEKVVSAGTPKTTESKIIQFSPQITVQGGIRSDVDIDSIMNRMSRRAETLMRSQAMPL